MSTASEDMAEIFSFLIQNKKEIEDKLLNDPILKNKVTYIKKNILKIDNKFTFE